MLGKWKKVKKCQSFHQSKKQVSDKNLMIRTPNLHRDTYNTPYWNNLNLSLVHSTLEILHLYSWYITFYIFTRQHSIAFSIIGRVRRLVMSGYNGIPPLEMLLANRSCYKSCNLFRTKMNPNVNTHCHTEHTLIISRSNFSGQQKTTSIFHIIKQFYSVEDTEMFISLRESK